MARRGHIGGGRQGFQINPIDFSRGGGGDNKDDTAMAMALMGYGKGTIAARSSAGRADAGRCGTVSIGTAG